MITLGGITLPEDMLITNLYAASKIDCTTRKTLGGRTVVYEAAAVGNLPIDLESSSDSGWITKSVLDQVVALVVPGATYTLSYEGRSFTVRFRNEDSPALEFTPLIPRPNAEAGDYFYGVIKLATV